MTTHVSLPEAQNLAQSFVNYSRRKISEEYFSKIEKAVSELTEEQHWARPNTQSLSVGVILLHLAGNIRQWIIHAIGGSPNVREREKEFAPENHLPKEELLENLRKTINEAAEVLKKLEVHPACETILSDRRVIQSMQETVFSVVYHATEHMAYHTGQLIYIAKAITGEDMKFYDL